MGVSSEEIGQRVQHEAESFYASQHKLMKARTIVGKLFAKLQLASHGSAYREITDEFDAIILYPDRSADSDNKIH